MERRHCPRRVINYPIWLICPDHDLDADNQFLAYALDISEGGMLIQTSQPIAGSAIKILASISNRVVEIVGRIVHIDSQAGNCKLGVQVDPLSSGFKAFYKGIFESAHTASTT